MTSVHVITLPDCSGRELSLDRLCRLTAILLAAMQQLSAGKGLPS